jgi:dTDP-4-dehydrorhamnose reductase
VDFAAAAARRHDVVALARRDLDITDFRAVERRVDAAAVAVNCAAFTDVDAARPIPTPPTRSTPSARDAWRGHAPGWSATHPHLHGLCVLRAAPDGGLGWRPDDLVHPVNVYGRTKLAGELAVLAAGGIVGEDVLGLRRAPMPARVGTSSPVMAQAGSERRPDPPGWSADQAGRPDVCAGSWPSALCGAGGRRCAARAILHVAYAGPPARLVGAGPRKGVLRGRGRPATCPARASRGTTWARPAHTTGAARRRWSVLAELWSTRAGPDGAAAVAVTALRRRDSPRPPLSARGPQRRETTIRPSSAASAYSPEHRTSIGSWPR